MVNIELVDLCRLVVAAVRESDNFDAAYLKKLLIHIVPQLLAEIEIYDQLLSFNDGLVVIDEPKKRRKKK
jgi:hypothetical protein